MKKILVMLTAATLIYCLPAYAGPGIKHVIKTGDKALDLSLKQLNVDVGLDTDNFVNSMSLSYGVKHSRIELMMTRHNMAPSDVYMALKLHRLSNRPLDFVIGEFKKSRGKGWGVTAKRLGIKPGSKEFHALKKGASGVLYSPSGKGKSKVKVKIKNRGGSGGGGRGKNK